MVLADDLGHDVELDLLPVRTNREDLAQARDASAHHHMVAVPASAEHIASVTGTASPALMGWERRFHAATCAGSSA
jgi:hypothetical protein